MFMFLFLNVYSDEPNKQGWLGGAAPPGWCCIAPANKRPRYGFKFGDFANLSMKIPKYKGGGPGGTSGVDKAFLSRWWELGCTGTIERAV